MSWLSIVWKSMIEAEREAYREKREESEGRFLRDTIVNVGFQKVC